jgi:hypothetical protein
MSEINFANVPSKYPKIGLKGSNLGNDGKSDINFEKIYHLIDCNEEIHSVREMNKLILITKFSDMLIGDMTLIDYFRKTDDVWKILNTDNKDSDKVKMIAEARCITERHARRILNKLEYQKS